MTKKKNRKSIRRMFKRRRGHSDRRLPLLVTAAATAPAFRAIQNQWSNIQSGNVFDVPYEVMREYTGYSIKDGTFESSKLISTLSGVLIGWGAGKLMNAVGVNKAMKRIPLVGRYIKL